MAGRHALAARTSDLRILSAVLDADSTHRLSVLRGIIRVEGEGTCQYEKILKATVRPHHALEAHSVPGSAKRSNVQPRVRGTQVSLLWMTRKLAYECSLSPKRIGEGTCLTLLLEENFG